jgi:hypothetical protein
MNKEFIVKLPVGLKFPLGDTFPEKCICNIISVHYMRLLIKTLLENIFL